MQVHLDVVDLDPAVVDVAKNWFGCVEDERMKLYAQDGLKFITDKAKQGTYKRELSWRREKESAIQGRLYARLFETLIY